MLSIAVAVMIKTTACGNTVWSHMAREFP